VVIDRLALQDVRGVAALHLRLLSARLSGVAGRKLLELYYETLHHSRQSECFVARDGNGSVCGLAVLQCGRHRPGVQVVRRHCLPFGWWLIVHVLSNPCSLYHLARFLWERRPLRAVIRSFVQGRRWCLLHGLAAEPANRGIGKTLLETALMEARSRGFQYILTSAFYGGTANHLYQKAGFDLLMTTKEAGRKANWYGRPL